MKKNSFKILAEAMFAGKLGDLPIPSLRCRTLKKEELTRLVKEEFREAQDLQDIKVQEGGFENVELASEINWAKTLKMKEAFKK